MESHGMNLQDLYEGREDKVLQLVQTELWPIMDPLKMTLKNGQTVMKRDKDGSILKKSIEKAIEIIKQYKGDHAERHIRAVQALTDYRDVQTMLTNVLLHGDGHGVVR